VFVPVLCGYWLANKIVLKLKEWETSS